MIWHEKCGTTVIWCYWGIFLGRGYNNVSGGSGKHKEKQKTRASKRACRTVVKKSDYSSTEVDSDNNENDEDFEVEPSNSKMPASFHHATKQPELKRKLNINYHGLNKKEKGWEARKRSCKDGILILSHCIIPSVTWSVLDQWKNWWRWSEVGNEFKVCWSIMLVISWMDIVQSFNNEHDSFVHHW